MLIIFNPNIYEYLPKHQVDDESSVQRTGHLSRVTSLTREIHSVQVELALIWSLLRPPENSFVMVATRPRKCFKLFGRRKAREDMRGIMRALLVYKLGSTLNPAWKRQADGATPIWKYRFFLSPLLLLLSSKILSQGGSSVQMLPIEILNETNDARRDEEQQIPGTKLKTSSWLSFH